MSKLCCLSGTVIVVSCLALVARIGIAQNASQSPAGPVAGQVIALLDVKYIFEHHARFKEQKKELNAEVERATAEDRAERTAIVQLNERLQEYRSGTPDYKTVETEIASRQANLTAKLQLRSREFGRKEAKLLCNVYREICDSTNQYAQQHGIDMVLRFSSESADPEQPDTVWQWIARPVVAYRNGLDITPAIVQDLNRSETSRPAPGQQPKVPFPQ
jgi:Skp family chaperone for outer membrane proteins